MRADGGQDGFGFREVERGGEFDRGVERQAFQGFAGAGRVRAQDDVRQVAARPHPVADVPRGTPASVVEGAVAILLRGVGPVGFRVAQEDQFHGAALSVVWKLCMWWADCASGRGGEAGQARRTAQPRSMQTLRGSSSQPWQAGRS